MSDHPVATPARTPTQEEWQAEVDAAHKIMENFVGAIGSTREAMWESAHWAYEADQQTIWVKLGYETMGEWLAQPEIHMSRRTFQRMSRVWRETVVLRQLDAPTLARLDVTKVDIVLPKLNDRKVTVQEAIQDAESLGGHDLREKYQGARPKPAPPEPEVFDTTADDLPEPDPVVDVDSEEISSEPDDLVPPPTEEEQELPPEQSPLEWATNALRAIETDCEAEPWHEVYMRAGGGADGLRAAAAFSLEALDTADNG